MAKPTVPQAKAYIEKKRTSGLAITGPEMTSTHQEALKALMGPTQDTSTTIEKAEREEKRRKILGGRK